MADYFQSGPNFVNPQYATPEQIAAQRAYAAELMKRSGREVNRPLGALANGLDAITAVLTRNQADKLQSDAAARNTESLASMIRQQQSGQRPDADTVARNLADPMASPEQRRMMIEMLMGKPVEDVNGRPGYASPITGVSAAPVQGNFQPGYRAPVQAEGVGTTAPIPAPGPVNRAPVPSSARVWGDREAEAAGLYPPRSPTPSASGPQAAASPGAPPATYLPPQVGGTVRELAGLGREVAANKTFTQGGAEAISATQKQDVATAMQAPEIKRIAGVMLDDLRTHGDKMTFGPTAAWSNEVKRAAANYLPGPMRSQMEALASADSFEKMSAQLTSLLARGSGGTDAQLFNSMKSVPGAHNSKEGAQALLLMINQVADQHQAMREYVSHARTPQEYEALRSQFFRDNPVINPITGNPIAQDLTRERNGGGGGGARIISVRPAQ
ncbi:MAG: hypothetical protein EKK33_08970 [Bradyrhizobiaceae bacterium]|nr:MAG: hypothetical protein EKK33_08970 [Bradyrhizobiaceae bacterium]